jgi:phytoene/squalene synthetase
LQLTNFWQDIKRDMDKGRIYVPVEDLNTFRYTEQELERGEYNPRFKNLLKFEIERTRRLFLAGEELEKKLTKRLAFEIALFRGGGVRILNKIEKSDYNVFGKRPVLSKGDKARLFIVNLIRQVDFRTHISV